MLSRLFGPGLLGSKPLASGLVGSKVDQAPKIRLNHLTTLSQVPSVAASDDSDELASEAE